MAGGVLASRTLGPVARPVNAATFVARRSDDRLAALVAQGSQQAFAVLYERYHQQLYRYCRSILHDDGDAQDALQAAMTAALTALRRGAPRAPVRPWLYRIAHNESISLIRQRGRAQSLTQAAEPLIQSAEQQAGERARFAQLLADLSALPERQRAALVMRELSGLSHQEIAVALDTSEGATRQLIFDARRALSAFASGRAMQCEDVRRMVSDGDRRMLRAHTVRAHLRDCASCDAFASSIRSRSVALNSLVPLLGPVASVKLLGRVLGRSPAGSASASSAAASTTISAKLLVGAALFASVVTTLVVTQDLRATPPPRTGRQIGISLPPLSPLRASVHLPRMGPAAHRAPGGPRPERAEVAALRVASGGLRRKASAGRRRASILAPGSVKAASTVSASGVGSRGRHLDRGAAQNHLGVGPPRSRGVGPPAGKGRGPASTRSAGSAAGKP